MNEDRSRRYHRLRRRAGVVSVALTAGGLLALLVSGAAHSLRDVAAAMTGGGPAAAPTVVVFAGLLHLLHELATLPVTFYRTFLLDRRYGLSLVPLVMWAADHLKASAIGLLLALAGATVVYLTLAWWPRWWWLASAAAFIGATVLLVKLAPVVLLPLFYRVRPLDREALRDRLFTLSERAGVPVLGVHVWGLGEKTCRANAALVGTGATRRILLSDTLLSDFTDDEIEVILAHELGHHQHRDILKAIALESIRLVAAFGAAAAVLAALWRPLGLVAPADVAGLPLLLLAGGVLSAMTVPVLNALSRANERRADRYALTLTGRPAEFESAMRRLGALNLAEQHPSRLALWLFHTHPPFEERIEHAQAFQGSEGGG